MPRSSPTPPLHGAEVGDLPPSPPAPQLKISFSETALETTYQYPSESSVLRELGPEPEAPGAPAAQPDDEEEEEEELQAEPRGGLRSKALLVGEWTAAGARAPPGVQSGHCGPGGKRWRWKGSPGPLTFNERMGKLRSWRAKCTSGLPSVKPGLSSSSPGWVRARGLGQSGLSVNFIFSYGCGLREIT